jgi:orotidine-5'-phosphate decarboxylase
MFPGENFPAQRHLAGASGTAGPKPLAPLATGETVVKPAALAPVMKDRLIVALDFPETAMAFLLADRLQGICRWLKVGLELYLTGGDALVAELRRRGFSVFLDLKFHDIPNTVGAAVRAAERLGAGMLTIHAAGGPAMLRAAAEAAEGPGAPILLAVTVLTSMDAAELKSTGVPAPPADQVEQLAKMASGCGIHGFVCSAEEAVKLRSRLGGQAVLVTPGIRPTRDAAGDQKRVATPGDAIAAGANYLVVGRPITRAADPTLAAQTILEEMEAGSRQ